MYAILGLMFQLIRFAIETLIVWQEPGSGVDMALSFQEAEGCALIWFEILPLSP